MFETCNVKDLGILKATWNALSTGGIFKSIISISKIFTKKKILFFPQSKD